MFADITDNFATKNVPGGAATNSARVTQWILREPCTAVLGSVGSDNYAAKLSSALREARVDTIYQKFASFQTGICAALVTPDRERSLITELGAAS